MGRNSFFYIPVFLFFLLGAIGLWCIPYGDEILFFNPYRQGMWGQVFKYITKLGEWYIWAAALLVLIVLKWKPQAIAFVVVGVLLIPINYQLKDKIGIDRPITFFDKQGLRDAVITVPDLFLNSGQTSFPSGHTASAFALYTLLAAFVFKKKKAKVAYATCFALAAILVGLSRIFLAQHFLIDVLGGAALGLLLASFGIWLSTYLTKHFRPTHIPLA